MTELADVKIPGGEAIIEKGGKLTGLKTLLVNGGIVVATAGLQWAAGINWVEYVGPNWAVLIVTGVNIALRFVTKGPVGSGLKLLFKRK